MTPTASAPPSTAATSVVNTCAGGTPSASLASRPYDPARGSCGYSCRVNPIFARSSAIVAMVPRPATSVTYRFMGEDLQLDRELMALALRQARTSLEAGG